MVGQTTQSTGAPMQDHCTGEGSCFIWMCLSVGLRGCTPGLQLGMTALSRPLTIPWLNEMLCSPWCYLLLSSVANIYITWLIQVRPMLIKHSMFCHWQNSQNEKPGIDNTSIWNSPTNNNNIANHTIYIYVPGLHCSPMWWQWVYILKNKAMCMKKKL